MALANKKHERFFSTTGSDADKVSTSKLTEIKDLWDKDVANGGNLNLLNDPNLGPLLYQMQQMQDELDELRRYITSNEIAPAIDASALPISAPRTSGLLWCDTRDSNTIKRS